MGRVKTLRQPAQRFFGVFLAALFCATIAGQFLPPLVDAVGGQVSGRSITMSTSSPGATSASYTVNFTPATSETHPDVIVDFCNSSSDPIVGDTCSGTAGTDVPNLSAAAASGWTVTAIDSNHGVMLTTTTNSFTSGTAITPIVLTGVTNPSNTTGFYGRILTYATGGASGHTSASPGSYVDYGGIALSTASNISITSKVFETLSFCVYQSTCGTAPVLQLGDPTTDALSSSNAYINSNAAYSLSTNAGSGVNVTMTGTTLCRSTGTNCQPGANYASDAIAAIGSSATTSTAGSEQFGMCVDSTTPPTDVTVNATYTDSSSTKCHNITNTGGVYTGSGAGSSTFGFNDITGSGGTNNAAGSQVLSSTGPVSSYTGSFTFLANISLTTPAGVYTTSLNMVATGTF